jgi:hypothetical protein
VESLATSAYRVTSATHKTKLRSAAPESIGPAKSPYHPRYAARGIPRLAQELSMRLIQDSAVWRPLDSAPEGEDVILLVTDGPSEPYPLKRGGPFESVVNSQHRD